LLAYCGIAKEYGRILLMNDPMIRKKSEFGMVKTRDSNSELRIHKSITLKIAIDASYAGAAKMHSAIVVLCVLVICVTVWGILHFAHSIGERIGQRGSACSRRNIPPRLPPTYQSNAVNITAGASVVFFDPEACRHPELPLGVTLRPTGLLGLGRH
jgi:hypothetical protein